MHEDQAPLPLVGGREDGALIEQEERPVEKKVEASQRRAQSEAARGNPRGLDPDELLATTAGERDRFWPVPLVSDLALMAMDDKRGHSSRKPVAVPHDG